MNFGGEIMQNLENQKRLEVINKEMQGLKKKYSKHTEYIKNCDMTYDFHKNLSIRETSSLGMSALCALCGGVTGMSSVALAREPLIKSYLGKPENQQIVQDLYEQTGLSNINDLGTFLTGKDGFAKVLYEQSGARDFIFNTTVEVVVGVALGVMAISIFAPYVSRKYKQAYYKHCKIQVTDEERTLLRLSEEKQQIEQEIRNSNNAETTQTR